MTNIYQAFMDAADHIERYPETYRYERVAVPAHNGEGYKTGCLFGWTVSFAGGRENYDMSIEAMRLGFPADEGHSPYLLFAKRMRIKYGVHWMRGPVSERLRWYARTYYPQLPEAPAESIAEMLAPFRGARPNWAKMRDRESAFQRFRSRLGAGLARVLARPLKEGSNAGVSD